MPPRPPKDRDPTVHYEPLRASVLDAFEQLGAFDDDSGIVEWMFPDVHEQKERQRSRVQLKLPEVVAAPEPEIPTPKRSRFFGIGSRARSKSRDRKEPKPALGLPTASTKLKPKKSRSSPNLRKDAEKSATPVSPVALPPVPFPTAASPTVASPRLSIFSRKTGPTGAQSLEQPRPSISEEEWQQITMTGSITDYDSESNPFLGVDPHDTNDVGVGSVKRDGLQRRLSRFTSSFTRSTLLLTREHSHSTSSPTLNRASTSTSTTSTSSQPPMSPTSDPATPTRPTIPLPQPTSPMTEHSNASTSTLPAAPQSPSIEEVPRDDAPLEQSSQMDHPRTSLSDISEGEASESSTLSIATDRRSQDSAVKASAS